MTNTTGCTTGFEVRAIPAAVVRELLNTDDAGNAPLVLTDEDGSPLRCCLEPAHRGERVALVSYAPLRRWAVETGAAPGAYDEVGPVFIHADPCAGPASTGYPPWLASGSRVLRGYGHDGRIRTGRLVQPDPDCSPAKAELALRELLDDLDVAVVHARALEFGCFTFEVRRAEARPTEAARSS
jgi:hypothetical protein